MKALFKWSAVVVAAAAAIIVLLVFVRAQGKVVVTDKPSRELTALSAAWLEVRDPDPAAWATYSSVVKEVTEGWKRASENAGPKPDDFPKDFIWPYDCSDALRANVPDAVDKAASHAIADLRASGFFTRLASLRNGPFPVIALDSAGPSMMLMDIPQFGSARNTARHNALRMRLAPARRRRG